MEYVISGTQPTDGSSTAEAAHSVNIPEGSCAGTDSSAVDGSVLQEGATRKTGVCPLCGGRFRLSSDTRLLDHTAAADRER
jgi:hypothetical protein